MVGSSCQEVTAAIEEQLGIVVNQQQTAEYYAQNQVQSATVVAQSNYGDW
ncbi:MAG: DUF2997 domain-containing protein [Waterburya sp.]